MVEREGTPRVPSRTLAEAGTRTPEIAEGLESAGPVFVAVSRTTVGIGWRELLTLLRLRNQAKRQRELGQIHDCGSWRTAQMG